MPSVSHAKALSGGQIASVRSQGAPRGRIASIAGYFREVIAELRKAVWPTRDETKRLTVLVIVISVAVGVILGTFDYGFTKLVAVFLGG